MMTRNLLLIGRTGKGKSALANLLTDTNDFQEGKHMASQTMNIQYEKYKINGFDYQVIDTPGFNDTRRDKSEVMNEVARVSWLLRDGLNQILFVVNEKFTKEDAIVYSFLEKVLFDKNVSDYITIVRTRFPDFQTKSEC